MSDWIRIKVGTNVLHLNIHRLTESDFNLTSYFQDGVHDGISPKNMLSPDESIRNVHPAAMHHRH